MCEKCGACILWIGGNSKVIVNLIRHGYTQGNVEKRYIGITDETLCDFGIEQLKSKEYPKCEYVYSSPMIRCIQTIKIIYPNTNFETIQDFKECNFGSFENHNYLELCNNEDYQAWIDSNGTLPFPNGESREEFSNRSYLAFKRVISKCEFNVISMVVHGGTIMSIMEHLRPNSNYFDFQIKNGEYITIKI